jgi:hypothetical protein
MAATANPEEFIIPSALSTNAAMLKRLLRTDAPGATLHRSWLASLRKINGDEFWREPA